MAHALLSARPAERAELVYQLRLEALKTLGDGAVSPQAAHREYVRAWVEAQTLTSRCLHCSYVRADVTLAEARRAFAQHDCPGTYACERHAGR